MFLPARAATANSEGAGRGRSSRALFPAGICNVVPTYPLTCVPPDTVAPSSFTSASSLLSHPPRALVATSDSSQLCPRAGLKTRSTAPAPSSRASLPKPHQHLAALPESSHSHYPDDTTPQRGITLDRNSGARQRATRGLAPYLVSRTRRRRHQLYHHHHHQLHHRRTALRRWRAQPAGAAGPNAF